MKKMARNALETGSVGDRQLMVGDLVERLTSHQIYHHVCDEQSLRIFMRAHVFAVWDFQSLLKALQRIMTCVDIPWLPSGDPVARGVEVEGEMNGGIDKGSQVTWEKTEQNVVGR